MILVLQKSSADTERRGGAGERSSPHCAAKGLQISFAALLRRPGPGGFAAGPQWREELEIGTVTGGTPKEDVITPETSSTAAIIKRRNAITK